MDCTYKTNKYRFPLLEIVGVTSTEMTFSVAFVFLENERVDNYTWALEKLKTIMDENMLPNVILTDREIALMNAIQNVFPNVSNLLCRWHISRNVLAHCKKLFETNEKWETFICSWNVLVLSSMKQEYIHNLSLMEGEFSNYPIALDYVKQAWLDKYKENFVAAWTDLVMHLGNSTTNRAESSHSQLKRQLGSSQGNFLTSWTKIHGLLQLQHNEIKASFERSLTLVQHSFKPSDFKELRGFVSRNALNMILDEYERVDSNDAICSCVVRLTHGLPCAHEISGHKRECRPIPLSSIHSHWRKLDLVPTIGNESPKLNCKVEMEMIEKCFDKIDDGSKLQLLKKLKELANPASTSLIEPEVKCNTRGQPPTKHDTSTRRDPYMFEYVLSTQGNHSPSLMSLSTNAVHSKRREKLKEVKSQTFKPISFIDSFPVGLRPYIHDVKDVLGDGNCGFRVVASWMDMGDDNWIQVRRDLIDELQQHYDYYTQLFGYSDRAKEVMNSLSYVEANPGIDYWMTMPDTGHLIASK